MRASLVAIVLLGLALSAGCAVVTEAEDLEALEIFYEFLKGDYWTVTWPWSAAEEVYDADPCVGKHMHI
ncbi:hypothetical protein KIPB_017130 [Kipferlia bialata]|uniref:Uncharacterized protein n=1 Tax=Kipferlia bialata TaxID=797122 RepID=A0A391P3W1_9EUKA|nr:hypothetical protein KIPB_017130 [Kipferlia bialata]|eukprot:g17130.t1